MKLLLARWLAVLSLLALPACKALDKRPDHYAMSSHASRAETLALLEQRGVIQPETRVLSTKWNEDTKEYVVTIRTPTRRHIFGIPTVWYVDRWAKRFHGGGPAH